MTPEHKLKISEVHKGKILSEVTKRKISIAHKGKTLTDEHKRKIGLANSVKRRTPEENEHNRLKHLGKKFSEETKRKMSIARRKENNANWQGGITPIHAAIRNSKEYVLWRKAVFERDNHTCIWCGKRGGNLHADHIKPFAQYPELRFAIDNGRTLCIPCHRTTETYPANLKIAITD
jgi:5-methylcytosine-specific restriction endonuclease McrA